MKDRKLLSFTTTWFLFVIVLWWKFYQEEVEIINTTSLAFHYGYGFISRGFMGTMVSRYLTTLSVMTEDSFSFSPP